MKENVGTEGLAVGSTLLNGRYLLKQLLGKGSFGYVYQGISTMRFGKSPETVAIKVEANTTRGAQLTTEIKILQTIHSHSPNILGFSKLYKSGVEEGHTFMIMDLMGPNLHELMGLCGGKFSLKTGLLLAIQIFARLEVIHEIGYVYRDVKPENFVMGIGKTSKDIFLIDFGLCKKYRDESTQLFFPFKEHTTMAGTIRYCSLNSHLGMDQSRRDDLQAACYLLVYLLKGELPWQGLVFDHKFEKDHRIMESKLKITPEALCAGLPVQIRKIFEYVKSLDFYQDPDYRFIGAELTSAFEMYCSQSDLLFDWQKLPPGTAYNEGLFNIIYLPNSQIPKEPVLSENNVSHESESVDWQEKSM